jgi:carboxypeptidase Q
MFTRTVTLGASALILAATAMAQEAAPLDAAIESTTKVLIQQGLNDDVGLKFGEDLTTEVGQRLAGSESEARARDWSVAEL